jgi:hypothetical protein
MENNIFDFIIQLTTVTGICVAIYFWYAYKREYKKVEKEEKATRAKTTQEK